ncbi:MAG: anti sigma factor C-terminal domain-containing protein [Cellulosilyticaceae bacterium]
MKDKELEDLFEVEVLPETLLEEARLKSRVRQVLISVATIILVGLLVWLVHLQITPYWIKNRVAERSFYEGVVGANRFEMPFRRKMTFFGGEAEGVQYKIVGQKPVVVGKVTIADNDVMNVIDMSDGGLYSDTGHKLMMFYRPEADEIHVRKEFETLENMASGRLVEVGVSLDQAMTRSELEALLPQGVMLNWCWVDTGEVSRRDIARETEVIGYPMIDESGEKLEDPEAKWLDYLDLIKDRDTKYRDYFKQIYEQVKEGPQILGAVLVGEPEALRQLRRIEQIRGAVIGEVSIY